MQDLSAHCRLYGALKRQLSDSRAVSAGRILLNDIADANRVSVTPVREVLFRLVGERLVSLHSDGGFAASAPDAAALADLYGWNGHHLLSCVHLLPEMLVASALRGVNMPASRDPVRVLEATELLFASVARATGNGEFALQVEAASDRLRIARQFESSVFADSCRELRALAATEGAHLKSNLRRRIQAYHRRRIEHAGQIAALLAHR